MAKGDRMVNPDGTLKRQYDEFCLEYAKTHNQTRAYLNHIAANPEAASYDAAGVSAFELLKNPKIQERLAEIDAETQAARPGKIADLAEIAEGLTDVFRRVSTDDVLTSDGSVSQMRAAIKESLKAAELLIRMKGGFLDRQQVELSGAVPIVIKDDL